MNRYVMSFGNFGYLSGLNFLPPLLIRLYLATVFWVAGTTHIGMQGEITHLLGSAGFPLPVFFAQLLVGVEIIGAIFLLVGFAVRWICVPLIISVVMAAIFVHWSNGWLYIVTEGNSGLFYTDKTVEAYQRLGEIKQLLQENKITDTTNLVVLNDGVEITAIYFIMLLTLFFMGAGRYFSIDYFIFRRNQRKMEEQMDAHMAEHMKEHDEMEPRIVESSIVSPVIAAAHPELNLNKDPIQITPPPMPTSK